MSCTSHEHSLYSEIIKNLLLTIGGNININVQDAVINSAPLCTCAS